MTTVPGSVEAPAGCNWSQPRSNCFQPATAAFARANAGSPLPTIVTFSSSTNPRGGPDIVMPTGRYESAAPRESSRKRRTSSFEGRRSRNIASRHLIPPYNAAPMTADARPSTDHKTGAPPAEVDVAVVGGGIAGLYCCLQLFDKYSSATAREPVRTVALFEGSSRLGGRIESWRIDPKRYDTIRSKAVASSPGAPSVLHQMEKQDEAQLDAERAGAAPVPLDDFMVAEFGPMRIEPAHQPFLRKLLDDLHLTPESGPYRKWADQVPFSPYQSEAPSEPAFHLDGEEAEQTTILDLMLLALRRIFECV